MPLLPPGHVKPGQCWADATTKRACAGPPTPVVAFVFAGCRGNAEIGAQLCGYSDNPISAYGKSRQCRLWRSLLFARRTVLNEMRSIESVVRPILREAGVKLGTPSRADFVERVRELAGGDSAVTPLVEPLLASLRPRRWRVYR